MAKKVEKLTKEEINKGRKSMVSDATASYSSSAKKTSKIFPSFFIDKISDKKIREVFEPFGLIYFDRFENKSGNCLYVVCKDFEVQLDDYYFNFSIDFSNEPQNEPLTDFSGKPIYSSFDKEAFFNYCSKLEITPEQALSEVITVNLFKGLDYARARKQEKTSYAQSAFAELPSSMKTLLKPIQEKTEAGIKATFNRQKFGDYNIEERIALDNRYDD